LIFICVPDRLFADAEFVEKLEQSFGTSLRPKKGGWPRER
jgi:hypothetical protein